MKAKTDDEDFECMDLDGEGAVIYSTQLYNEVSPADLQPLTC